MSVLPPRSAEEAGIPMAMRQLMKEPFSPLIDFYPVDFGLDLNGKRFTWQAVVLLPFIDEPRLVKILDPLLKRLSANEMVRNRHGQELLFGHKDDKVLFRACQLAQASFEAGHAGLKQNLREQKDPYMFGCLEGWQMGGANRQVVSPIEGLPDVEESHAVSATYQDPEKKPHRSVMLEGIQEVPLIVNASDMDEKTRMNGFGGDQAMRMILQALGKDPRKKPKYKDLVKLTKTKAPPAPAKVEHFATEEFAAPVVAPAQDTVQWGPAEGVLEYEEDESEFADPAMLAKHPVPPSGAKVIKVRAAARKTTLPKAPAGFQAVVKRPGKRPKGEV
jgi:5'-3' exoribonuclease 2